MPNTIKTETLGFLRSLKSHNNREWFTGNKQKYLAAKDNFILFVQTVLDEVSKFDESVAGTEASTTVYRIYRDMRFSRDPTPYKTNFGASLTGKGKEAPLAGYYLHLEPGSSFLAGGVYMSEPRQLAAIRERISGRAEEFLSIVKTRAFKKNFVIDGEKLSRVPQGFSKSNPMAEYLKFKQLVILRSLDDKEVVSNDFAATCARVFRLMAPYNGFMNRAVLGLAPVVRGIFLER
jgi:uncharacterized protein (TIGR02453 family)